eukprot:6477947-Amphidinium_carterae.1
MMRTVSFEAESTLRDSMLREWLSGMMTGPGADRAMELNREHKITEKLTEVDSACKRPLLRPCLDANTD